MYLASFSTRQKPSQQWAVSVRLLESEKKVIHQAVSAKRRLEIHAKLGTTCVSTNRKT